MASILIITPVEKLQEEINKTINSFKNTAGIYISLNKTQKSVESILKKNKIPTDKLFFIDCVTTEKTKEDVLHMCPRELEKLSYATKTFIEDIKGKKFVIIDALSTLLIYNDEKKVAAFVREVTKYASKTDVEVIAFSPSTKGEELLNKIFNFFDEVKKGKNEKINENREELIY